MKTVLVASSKGGVGKTTIATHLAAHAALQGRNTVLLDADPQRASTQWAQRRADLESAVLPLDGTRGRWQGRVPAGTERLCIDAPAGAMARQLGPFLDEADARVVPVPPSMLDVEASVPFLDARAGLPRVRRGERRGGQMGNKSRTWNGNSQSTVELLSQWTYPLAAQLRDRPFYVLLSGLGRRLFDYHSMQVREHQAVCQPLLKWMSR